jgi:hypothetical protein
MGGVKHRAHCNHPRERNAACRRMQCHSQCEISTEREAAEKYLWVRMQAHDPLHRINDFPDARRVEQLAVQMMAGSVIAQMQPIDREAVLVKMAGCR